MAATLSRCASTRRVWKGTHRTAGGVSVVRGRFQPLAESEMATAGIRAIDGEGFARVEAWSPGDAERRRPKLDIRRSSPANAPYSLQRTIVAEVRPAPKPVRNWA